jgi:transcription antitermination factor NusG
MVLSEPESLLWYALRIQSKLASIACATLSGKGYETYLPLCRSRRRWSDRVKHLDVPLFPGYMFCRFDARDRLPIMTTVGVINIVSAGKRPIPVYETELEDIRAIVRSGLVAQPWPFLRVGSWVYVDRGPLAGVEGIITNIDKVHRLIVSISLLQRSVAVEIDREWASPLPERVGPRSATLSSRPQFFTQVG